MPNIEAKAKAKLACSTNETQVIIKCLLWAGASVGMELSTHARTVRKSTSRNCKQLQFAPLQLGRISEQPQRCPSAEGMADELLSPGRSKSLGAAVDRALLKSFVVDVESDDGKDRPHSATQFSRKVGAAPHPTLPHSTPLHPLQPHPTPLHPLRPTPTHPHPSNPTPSNPSPSNPTPSQPYPISNLPLQPHPLQPHPSNPTPSNPTASYPTQPHPTPP